MWNGKKNSGMKKTPSTDSPQQLNLTEIVRTRVGGRKGRMIPGWLLRGLERLIRQDELNKMLRVGFPLEGWRFSEKILDYLDIDLQVRGLDALPEGRQYMFASNHPLGGLDGIAMVAVLGRKYGDDNIKVLVNDLLMNVQPLAGVFLPVNKFGKDGGRENTRRLNEALASGKQILMFPAGLVSRLHPGGVIKDLAWQKSFVTKALEYGCEIVPVRFRGENSMRFYKTARMRKRLGLKVNIEQALLPSEVCKSRGKHFEIDFFAPVDPRELKEQGLKPKDIAGRIYSILYS